MAHAAGADLPAAQQAQRSLQEEDPGQPSPARANGSHGSGTELGHGDQQHLNR